MTCQGSFSAIASKQSDAIDYLANSANYPCYYATENSNEEKKFIADLKNSPWVKHYRSVCVEMSRGSQRFSKSNDSVMPNMTSHCVVRPPHVYSVGQRVVSFIRGAFRRNSNVSTSGITRASAQTDLPKHPCTHLKKPRQYRGSQPVTGWKNRKVTIGNDAVSELMTTKKSDQCMLFSTRNSVRHTSERGNMTRSAGASTSSSRDQSNSQNSTPNPRPSALVISSSNRSREGVAKRTRFSLHPSTCNAPPDLIRPRRDSEDTANSVSSLVDMSHRSEIISTDLTSVCGDSASFQKPRTCENSISRKARTLLSDSTARDKELQKGKPSEPPKAFPTSVYEEKRHQVMPVSTCDGVKTSLTKVQGTKRGQTDHFRLTRSGLRSFELCSLSRSTQSPGLTKAPSNCLQVQRHGPYRFRRYRKLISELDQMHRNYAAPYEIARELVDNMCQFRLNEIAQSLLLSKPRPAYYDKMTMITDSNGDANTRTKDETNLAFQPSAQQICNQDNSDEFESLRSKESCTHTTSAALSTQEPVGILCLPVRRARNKLKLENVATKSKINKEINQHVFVDSCARSGYTRDVNGEFDIASSRSLEVGYQPADKTKPPRTREISIQSSTAEQCNQPTEKGVQFDGEPVLYIKQEFMGLTQPEECQNIRICHGTQTSYSISLGGDHDGFSELDDSQDLGCLSAGESSVVRTVTQSPQPIDVQPPRTPLSSTIAKPLVIRNPMSPVEINMTSSNTPPSCNESKGCPVETQSTVSFAAACQEGVNTVASSIQERTRSGNSESVSIQPNMVDCICPLAQSTGQGTHYSGPNKSTVSVSCLPRDDPITLMNVAKLVVLPSPLQLDDDPGLTTTPLLYRCHVASSATQTELNEQYEIQPSVSLPEQQSISSDVIYAIQSAQSSDERSELVPEKPVTALDTRGMPCKRDKVTITAYAQTGSESMFSVLGGSGRGVIDSVSTVGVDQDANAKLHAKTTINQENVSPRAEFASTCVLQAKQQHVFDAGMGHWKISNYSLPTRLSESKERKDEPNEISESSTVWSHPHLAEDRKLSPERECKSENGYYVPVMRRPGSILSDLSRTPLSRALQRNDIHSGDSRLSVCVPKARRNVAFLTHHGRAHSIRRQKWTNGDLETNDADTSSSISPPPKPGFRMGNRYFYEQKDPIISQNTVSNRGRARHPNYVHRRKIDSRNATPQHRSVGDYRTCLNSGLHGLRRPNSTPQVVRLSSLNSEGTKILDAHSVRTSASTASSPITGKVSQLGRRQPVSPEPTRFRHANCSTPRNMLPRSTKKISRSISSLVDSHRCRRLGSSHSTGCGSAVYNQEQSNDPHTPRPGNTSGLLRPASGEPKLAQRTLSTYNRRMSPRRLRSLKSPHTHNSTRCNEDSLLRHTFASLQKVRTKTLCSTHAACRPPMVFKR
ncbi:unnamed protein product [Dicrocoelium dendriticum]|nr:unnamed protein product [Dicrocoelium dendriticum]